MRVITIRQGNVKITTNNNILPLREDFFNFQEEVINETGRRTGWTVATPYEDGGAKGFVGDFKPC